MLTFHNFFTANLIKISKLIRKIAARPYLDLIDGKQYISPLFLIDHAENLFGSKFQSILEETTDKKIEGLNRRSFETFITSMSNKFELAGEKGILYKGQDLERDFKQLLRDFYRYVLRINLEPKLGKIDQTLYQYVAAQQELKKTEKLVFALKPKIDRETNPQNKTDLQKSLTAIEAKQNRSTASLVKLKEDYLKDLFKQYQELLEQRAKYIFGNTKFKKYITTFLESYQLPPLNTVELSDNNFPVLIRKKLEEYLPELKAKIQKDAEDRRRLEYGRERLSKLTERVKSIESEIENFEQIQTRIENLEKQIDQLAKENKEQAETILKLKKQIQLEFIHPTKLRSIFRGLKPSGYNVRTWPGGEKTLRIREEDLLRRVDKLSPEIKILPASLQVPSSNRSFEELAKQIDHIVKTPEFTQEINFISNALILGKESKPKVMKEKQEYIFNILKGDFADRLKKLQEENPVMFSSLNIKFLNQTPLEILDQLEDSSIQELKYFPFYGLRQEKIGRNFKKFIDYWKLGKLVQVLLVSRKGNRQEYYLLDPTPEIREYVEKHSKEELKIRQEIRELRIAIPLIQVNLNPGKPIPNYSPLKISTKGMTQQQLNLIFHMINNGKHPATKQSIEAAIYLKPADYKKLVTKLAQDLKDLKFTNIQIKEITALPGQKEIGTEPEETKKPLKSPPTGLGS